MNEPNQALTVPVAEEHEINSVQLRLSEVTVQVLIIFILLTALIAVTGWWDPNFFSRFNLRSIARDTAIWSLFALGQGIVIISGGIDLSVGSLICFFGVSAIILLESGVSFPIVLLIVFGAAAVIGMIHGILISRLDLQPFLVTLCSLLTFRGLARVLTHDQTASFDAAEHPLFRALATWSWWGIPMPVFLLVAVLIPLGFFMHCTVPGRYMYAIGANAEAARYSGVRVGLLRTWSYVLCTMLTAVAALLEAADVGSVPPSSAGMAYEMYGITGAVLGGCALRGGRGSLIGVVLGMAILRVVKSAVIFLGISTYWTFAVTGLVLLGAVIVDSAIRQRRAK
ncbi:MAG: ABC transporter permease [Pirellulales bacterium]